MKKITIVMLSSLSVLLSLCSMTSQANSISNSSCYQMKANGFPNDTITLSLNRQSGVFQGTDSNRFKFKLTPSSGSLMYVMSQATPNSDDYYTISSDLTFTSDPTTLNNSDQDGFSMTVLSNHIKGTLIKKDCV